MLISPFRLGGEAQPDRHWRCLRKGMREGLKGKSTDSGEAKPGPMHPAFAFLGIKEPPHSMHGGAVAAARAAVPGQDMVVLRQGLRLYALHAVCSSLVAVAACRHECSTQLKSYRCRANAA